MSMYIRKNSIPMLYNLRNGKTIEMSVEEYFRLTDEDIADLDTLDVGEAFEDPFTGSALLKDAVLFTEAPGDSLLSISPNVKLLDSEFLTVE